MDRIEGFGLYLDLTLKKIAETYINVFKDQNIDLTVEQFVILQRIELMGADASQKDIVATNFRNRATTSRVISGLCKKEFVMKEHFKGDLKRFKLVLTPKGKKELNKARPHIQKLRELSKKNIDEKDFQNMLVVLEKIRKNYDEFSL